MIRWLALAVALAAAGCELDVELTPPPDGGVPDARAIDDAVDDAPAIDDAIDDAPFEPVDAPTAD